jgi:hypothetical protein
MRWVLTISFFAIVQLSFGQQENDSIPPTSTTDINSKIDIKKERPEGTRHFMTIIKKDTKNILYGNKCFEDFTRELGFIYEVQTKGRAGSMNGFARFWHNAATKTILCFKAGPWWKARVNKRRKECRSLSGDFVG